MNKILKNISSHFVWALIKKDETPIFMYHRVLKNDANAEFDKNIFITKDDFVQSISFFKKYFNVISLKELHGSSRRFKKECVITFDDGWIDTYQVAFPILYHYNIPATVFIPTGMIGTTKLFWFERLRRFLNHHNNKNNDISNYILHNINDHNKGILRLKEDPYILIVTEFKKLSSGSIDEILDRTENEFDLRDIRNQKERLLMNWDEVKKMSDAGVSFGSHCVNHSILTNLSSEEKHYEITSSRHTLLNKGINYVDCISFPNGNYDQETLDIATKAGYKLMLTASINKCGEGTSPLLAHRIGITKPIAEDNHLLAYSILKAKLKGKLYSSRQKF